MSANRSRRQIRSAILMAPAVDYIAWQLLVSCKPCDRPNRLIPMSMVQGGTVAQGLRRLRCASCGGHPADIVITNGLEGWRQTTIMLEGDGAYR